MRKVLCLLSVILVCASVNAQLKLHSNGRLTLGDVSPYSYYTTHLYGWGHYFSWNGSWGGKTEFKICLGAAGPRLAGNGGQVVFYDTETQQFNNIQVKNVLNYSDARAKTNIAPIKNATDVVLALNPVTYNFKNEEGVKLRKSTAGETMKEVGFLAQDVEQVLPEAVHEDEEGHKLINYTSIIPLLTESFKELTEEINKLQQEVEELKSSKSSNPIDSKSLIVKEDKPVLFQNTPNPFSEQTVIKYNIPNAYSSASICFFNLQGRMLLKKAITNGVGEGSVNLNANELGAGIYLYTLVVNNAEIDTKRLLITN